MDPKLSEASSGLNALTETARCSAVMPSPAPVLRQRTMLQRDLTLVITSLKRSADTEGAPVWGSLTWMWATAAPASYALTASSAISFGVMGR